MRRGPRSILTVAAVLGIVTGCGTADEPGSGPAAESTSPEEDPSTSREAGDAGSADEPAPDAATDGTTPLPDVALDDIEGEAERAAATLRRDTEDSLDLLAGMVGDVLYAQDTVEACDEREGTRAAQVLRYGDQAMDVVTSDGSVSIRTRGETTTIATRTRCSEPE